LDKAVVYLVYLPSQEVDILIHFNTGNMVSISRTLAARRIRG
jgi:hypothetical protein